MQLKMLTEAELTKLPTKRLLGCLNAARAVEHAEQRRLRDMLPVCCEWCNELLVDAAEYQEKVMKPTAHLTAYTNRIKDILKTRPHVQ